MSTPQLTTAELRALGQAGRLSQLFGTARDEPVILVALDDDAHDCPSPTELGTLPAVLIGIGDRQSPASELVDLVADDATHAAALEHRVRTQPLAATALALLLRHSDGRSIAAGLVAESATYSMLQAGPEFAAWRAARPIHQRPPATGSPLRIECLENAVVVTFDRPQRHNALDVQTSELLVEVLTDLLGDPDRSIVLRGAGPSFSSGGDLDEFGSFSDPASAHIVRLARSAGHLLAMMHDRVTAHLHGSCLGAGIELPAFAGNVIAHPLARFGLPEIGLGLIPGAGGTVSLQRRIGRHRTVELALSTESIDVATALEWGLIDRVDATVAQLGAADTVLPGRT